MFRKLTNTLILVVCMAMVFPVFVTGVAGEADIPEPMDVTFYLWGEKPTGMDDVVAEFESQTADILNMELYFDWTPLADYGNKIKLKLAAGEEVDSCFDAQWISLVSFVAEGVYTDLTDYFHNDAYPGLKAAFDPDLMSNNTLGTGRYYGIPFTQAYGTAPLIAIRGDLREKYGVPPVNDPETFRQYLDAIATNEPNMVPFACSKTDRTPTWVFRDELYRRPIEKLNAGVWEGITLVAGINADVYVEDYQLLGVYVNREPISARADFPAPYNEPDLIYFDMAYDFYQKGFIDPDVMTVTDMAGQFTSGKAASVYWNTAVYLDIANGLAASVPESKLEWYVVNPPIREGLTGQVQGTYSAWNFQCIPASTSKEKADRIMEFYDWMFSSTANHDLFEYGIEGRHFIAVGDDQYKLPDDLKAADVYAFPGYLFSWNANFIRLSADMPQEVFEANKKGNDPATYYNPIFSGFTFQPGPVETAIANPEFAVISDEWTAFEFGVVGEVAPAATALYDKFGSNAALMEDVAVIKAEFTKQFQEYLDERKLLDEVNGTVYPK